MLTAAVPWIGLSLAAIAAIWLARRDRAAARPLPDLVNHSIRLAAPAARPEIPVPPRPAEMREAAADLERAAEDARKAGAELKRVQADLERQRTTLEGLSKDADTNADRTKRELEDAQQQLETQRAELEKASRKAADRVRTAGEDLERLQQERLQQAAAAGVAQGISRSRDRNMAVLPDFRRGRNPAVPPLVPNAAAVAAAAGAGCQPGSGMNIMAGHLATVIVPGPGPGQTALDYSAATINHQTATAMALDNRIRGTEVFFEMRRLNQINRAFEAGPGVTMDRAVRIAAAGMPLRLTPLALDPSTGEITWPVVLSDPIYADLTAAIDELFRDRAAAGGSRGFKEAALLDQYVTALAGRMRENVRRYAAGRYGAAGTFLDSLRSEYERPLDD